MVTTRHALRIDALIGSYYSRLPISKAVLDEIENGKLKQLEEEDANTEAGDAMTETEDTEHANIESEDKENEMKNKITKKRKNQNHLVLGRRKPWTRLVQRQYTNWIERRARQNNTFEKICDCLVITKMNRPPSNKFVRVPGVCNFRKRMMTDFYSGMTYMVVMTWNGEAWLLQFPDVTRILVYVESLMEGCFTAGMVLEEHIYDTMEGDYMYLPPKSHNEDAMVFHKGKLQRLGDCGGIFGFVKITSKPSRISLLSLSKIPGEGAEGRGAEQLRVMEQN